MMKGKAWEGGGMELSPRGEGCVCVFVRAWRAGLLDLLLSLPPPPRSASQQPRRVG